MKRNFILGSFVITLFWIHGFGQTKTVTNFELEKFRQQRVQAEAEYNSQVKRGEAPSPTELAKREQERKEFYREIAEQAATKQEQAENYWQSQAFALRTEIAAIEAEINYVRARANEIPAPQTYYSVGYLPYNNFGYGNYGGIIGGVGFPQFPNNTNSVSVTTGGIGGKVSFNKGAQVTLRGGFNQTTVRQTNNTVFSANGRHVARANSNYNNNVSSGTFPINNLGGAQTNLYFGSVPYAPGILTAPFTLPTQQNLTREELLARLRLLEQNRAGLNARFSALQNEARRNGVRISYN